MMENKRTTRTWSELIHTGLYYGRQRGLRQRQLSVLLSLSLSLSLSFTNTLWGWPRPEEETKTKERWRVWGGDTKNGRK